MATENGFLRDGHTEDSGSDSDADHGAYYHPISADSDDAGDSSTLRSNGQQNENPDPHFFGHHAANGIADLDLDGDGGDGGSSEEEEEEREKEAEASISRAFSEDESRRSAPLTAENAARVVEAMRGVTFMGAVPDWAREVPEEHWVDQLRRMRGEPSSQS